MPLPRVPRRSQAMVATATERTVVANNTATNGVDCQIMVPPRVDYTVNLAQTRNVRKTVGTGLAVWQCCQLAALLRVYSCCRLKARSGAKT